MLRWFMFTTFQEISLCCFRFSVLNCFSCVQLYATLSTAACQAPLSMEILSARILKWVSMPSLRYLPDPGILPMSLMSPALAGGFFTTSTTREDLLYCNNQISKVISLFFSADILTFILCILILRPKSNSVKLLNRVWLFATPWTVACQASLSNINSRGLLKLMSIELVMPLNPLIFCHPHFPPDFNVSQHQDLF